MSDEESTGSGAARREPVPPCFFGAYELEEEVGRGGFGIIYRARHRALGRRCALKMIHARAAYPGDDAARALEHEAAAAASLDHPGIVRIHEFGSAEGRVFLAMEWVDGPDLGRWLPTRVVPPMEAARLFRGIVEAVAHAHEHGLFHHDLKPANVLVDSRGRVRLTDFGLARRAGSGSGVGWGVRGVAGIGTPQYAAPEQASEQYGEPRAVTDVFALGGLLYFLLTDRPPFRGDTISGTLRAVLAEEPPSPRLLRPGIPEDLEAICLRCLEKRPSRRYASVREVLEDVDRFLAGEGVLARAEGMRPRWSGPVRRRVAWGVGLAWVVVAGAWMVRSVTGTLAATQAEARAAVAALESERARSAIEVGKVRGERRVAHMRMAFEAFNHGAVEAAMEALQREVPREGEADGRGWEWGFLHRACVAVAGGVSAGLATGFGGEVRVAGAGAAGNPGAYTLAFTNAASGVVASGLLGGGLHAWVASASGVQIWDVVGARLVHEIPSEADAMRSAAWMDVDGAGAWVARAWVGGRLGLRALGVESATVSVEEPGWQAVPRYSGALDLGFSADGRRVVVADVANGVRVHAVPSMEPVWRRAGVPARRAEVSPTGQNVAAAASDGTVWIWGMGLGVTNAAMARVPQAEELAFAPDGKRVLAGTLDGRVVVLDVGTGQELGRMGPMGAAVLALAMDGAGTRVAAGTSDGRVLFWDAGSGEWMGTLRPGLGAVHGLRFLGRDGLAVAATGGVRVHPEGAR